MAAMHAKSSVTRTGNLLIDASDDACGAITITSRRARLRTMKAMTDVFAIVNPLSGAGANPDVAATRVALLTRRFEAAGLSGEVHLTERRRHAAELAASAVARGVHTVLAWGGDGTINEVASVL